MFGKVKAADLWHEHKLSVPVDLKQLSAELGLDVVVFPFQGRLKEVIIDGVIGVKPGLARSSFRWLVAHAIGHHMLHVGTSFYLESWQWVNHARRRSRPRSSPPGCWAAPMDGSTPRRNWAYLTISSCWCVRSPTRARRAEGSRLHFLSSRGFIGFGVQGLGVRG